MKGSCYVLKQVSLIVTMGGCSFLISCKPNSIPTSSLPTISSSQKLTFDITIAASSDGHQRVTSLGVRGDSGGNIHWHADGDKIFYFLFSPSDASSDVTLIIDFQHEQGFIVAPDRNEVGLELNYSGGTFETSNVPASQPPVFQFGTPGLK